MMMVPRRAEYSQLTGHIRRVLFVVIRKTESPQIITFVTINSFLLKSNPKKKRSTVYGNLNNIKRNKMLFTFKKIDWMYYMLYA